MKTKLVHSYSANSLAPSNIRNSHLHQIPLEDEDAPQSNDGRGEGDDNFLDLRVEKRGKRKPQRRTTLSGIDLFQKVKEKPSKNGFSGYLKDLSKKTFKMKTLYQKIPILSWIPVYNFNTLLADLISGITIALTVLPQSLAYATIAGLPHEYGLYSSLFGPFIYIFFGTSKFVTIGPTAGMAIITLSFTDEKPIELVILLTFLTGIITLVLGLLQLGFVLNFISVPVISGFKSAMAIAICSTQLPALFGLDFNADGFINMLKTAAENIGDVKTNDAVLGGVCIVVLLILQQTQTIARHFWKRIPHHLDNVLWFIATARNAIVVAICTGLFGYLGDPHPVVLIGEIEAGLPKFSEPLFWFTEHGNEHGHKNETTEPIEFSIQYFLTDNRNALLLVPLIAITEHITIAREADGTNRVDTSQEMTCIGFSNLIGSFWGSMPVTGSFIRPNQVNQSSRDQSPLGGCITGILAILTLLFLTPYFYHIPSATLAAVIVSGVIVMIDVRIIRSMWKSKKSDLVPWTVTFAIGLTVSLEYGILLGLGISIIYLLYYAALPQIRVNMGETSAGKHFVMVELDRSLIFPSIEHTQYALIKSGHKWGFDKYPVVIDCQHIQFADYSAAYGIQTLFIRFNAKPQRLTLWNVKPSVLRIVTGVMECEGVPFKYCSTETELEAWLELEDTSASQEDAIED